MTTIDSGRTLLGGHRLDSPLTLARGDRAVDPVATTTDAPLTPADAPAPGRPAVDPQELRARQLAETNLGNFRAWQLQTGPLAQDGAVQAQFRPGVDDAAIIQGPFRPGIDDGVVINVEDPTGGIEGDLAQDGLPADGVSPGDADLLETKGASAAEPVDLDAEPTELALDAPDFWEQAEPGVYTDGDLTYVVLEGDAEMRPFVRTESETFTDTAGELATDDSVIINGNQFGVTNWGRLDAIFSGSVSPNHTTAEGTVIADGDEITGDDEPQRFYIAQDAQGGYQFGMGEPPDGVDAAVGGLGPIIIDGTPYGVGNQYDADVPDGAPASGPPGEDFAPHLTQRNNNTYAALARRPDSTGKTIVAHSGEHDRIVVISQPDGAGDGQSIDAIRDALVAQGFDNAVFFDGSDSAMLRTGDTMRTTPGGLKDELITVGVQFF